MGNQVHCSPGKLLELAMTDLERTAQMSKRNNPGLVNINLQKMQ